jgi:hypothetical protein
MGKNSAGNGRSGLLDESPINGEKEEINKEQALRVCPANRQILDLLEKRDNTNVAA